MGGYWLLGGGVVGLRAISQGQSDTEAASLCGFLGMGGVFPDHLRGSCEVSPSVEGSVPLQSGPPPLPEAYLEEGMPVSARVFPFELLTLPLGAAERA